MDTKTILDHIKRQQIVHDIRDAQIFTAVQHASQSLFTKAEQENDPIIKFLKLNDSKREQCHLPAIGARWNPVQLAHGYLLCAKKAELYQGRYLQLYEEAARIMRCIRAFLELQLDDPRLLLSMWFRGAFSNSLSRKEIQLLFRAEEKGRESITGVQPSCDLEQVQERWQLEHVAPTEKDLEECQRYWFEQKQMVDYMFAFEPLFIKEITKLITQKIPSWHQQALAADVPGKLTDKWVHWKTRHWLKKTFFPQHNLGSFPDVTLDELRHRFQLQRPRIHQVPKEQLKETKRVAEEKERKHVVTHPETTDDSRRKTLLLNVDKLLKSERNDVFYRDTPLLLDSIAEYYQEHKERTPDAQEIKKLQTLANEVAYTTLDPILNQWKLDQLDALTSETTGARSRRMKTIHENTVSLLADEAKLLTKQQRKHRKETETPEVKSALLRAQRKEQEQAELEALEREEEQLKRNLVTNYIDLLNGYAEFTSWSPEICANVTAIMSGLDKMYSAKFPTRVIMALQPILQKYKEMC